MWTQKINNALQRQESKERHEKRRTTMRALGKAQRRRGGRDTRTISSADVDVCGGGNCHGCRGGTGACSRDHMISYKGRARARDFDMHEHEEGGRRTGRSDQTGAFRQGCSVGDRAL